MEYTITAPDGKDYTVEAPEGTPEEDIFEYVKTQMGQPAPVTEEPVESPSVVDNLSLLADKLSGNIKESGDISDKPFFLDPTKQGELATKVGESVVDVAETGMDIAIDAIVPEKMQRDFASWVAGQTVTKSFNKWLNGLSPEDRKIADQVGTVVSVATLGQVHAGGKIKKLGHQKHLDDISDITMPLDSTGEAVSRAKSGGGKYMSEKTMVEDVAAVKGIKKSANKYQDNIDLLQKKVNTEAGELSTKLSGVTRPVQRKFLEDNLQNAHIKFLDDKKIDLVDPLIAKQVDVLFDKLVDTLDVTLKDKGASVPVGDVFKVRKNYDKLTRDLLDLSKAAPDKKQILSEYVRSMRKKINQIVSVTARDVDVQRSLQKQSSYLNAIDNMAVKKARRSEPKGIINYLKSHPSIPAAALGGMVGTGTGMFFGLPLATVAAGGAGLGAGYLGAKALTSPLGLKATGLLTQASAPATFGMMQQLPEEQNLPIIH